MIPGVLIYLFLSFILSEYFIAEIKIIVIL